MLRKKPKKKNSKKGHENGQLPLNHTNKKSMKMKEKIGCLHGNGTL